jgi:hypothetical protein
VSAATLTTPLHSEPVNFTAIEDGAGIRIAMCYSRSDAEAIVAACNAAPALVECLRLTLVDLDREDFKSDSDRLIYIEKNIRAALSSAGVTP